MVKARLSSAAFISIFMGETGVPVCGCEPANCSPEQRKALGHGFTAEGADKPKQREFRRLIRASYGCDCAGENWIGKRNARRTEHHVIDIERWTGDRPDGCPWRAFYDPVVQNVLIAYRFFESGQLAQYWGADPPRLYIDAIAHYHVVRRRVIDKKMEQDRLERERKRKQEQSGGR